jgi:hypothetical protein
MYTHTHTHTHLTYTCTLYMYTHTHTHTHTHTNTHTCTYTHKDLFCDVVRVAAVFEGNAEVVRGHELWRKKKNSETSAL